MKLTLPKILGFMVLGAALSLLASNLIPDGEQRLTRAVPHAYGVDDPAFERAMGSLLGPSILPGNRVETLLNGDEIFPAMLAAIRGARRTITFETYIYWSGRTGKAFADALAERARAGVKVHIMVDWVGSQKMDAALVEEMKSAGAQFLRYHPLHWYTLDRMNNRTHRKLLVVDGRVGFTGGVGIADEWNGHAQDADHWRDTHYRIEGPAVAQMQAAFNDNWMKVSGEVLHGDAYFPPLERAGGELAQVFQSSSEGGSDSMQLMYLLSIAAARRSVDLSMAYFVPDDVSLRTIEEALRRGVKVRILMPGPITDASLVRRASRALWGRILEAGGEMYEFQPTMFHCKVMVVDRRWTSVGSTNFDSRSFRLNDEANLNVLDPAFAERQVRDFEQDLKRAKRVTLEAWRERPWQEKAWEHFLALAGSQL